MAAPCESSDLSQLSQSQIATGIRVLPGHILCNDKWRNSDLVAVLQGSVNVLYDDRLGVVDFHPSGEIAVIYLSEGDVVSGTACKRKIVKLRKANSLRGVVMIEKTATTTQYYSQLQKFTVLELGLVMIPVGSQKEAGGLLSQMVYVENHPLTNHFKVRPKPPPLDGAVLATLQMVPRLGEVKAKLLLERFKNLQTICNASVEQLSEVVGRVSATHIQNFFCEELKS